MLRRADMRGDSDAFDCITVPCALSRQEVDPLRLARLAGRILDCPSARIAHAHGVDPIFGRARGLDGAGEDPRTFGDFTLAHGRTLIVCDTRRDERFSRYLEVECFPNVRFVLGVPLRSAAGGLIGALTLFDYKPRKTPDADDVEEVEHLAGVIALAIDLQRTRFDPLQS